MQVIGRDLAQAYQKVHPYARITVAPTNSRVGLHDYATGSVDIALVSRNPEATELAWRPSRVIELGRDGIVIVVHPLNPFKRASREQIAQIFAGEINNWSELGAAPLPNGDAIQVLSREAGSGTRAAFDSLLMPGRRVTLTALVQPNERDMLTYVAGHPGGVGYVSFNYWKSVTGPPALAVEGILPTLDTIQSEKYPLMRTVYMVVPDDAAPDLASFISYVESPEGRTILNNRIKATVTAEK